jgi:gluconolactonase
VNDETAPLTLDGAHAALVIQDLQNDVIIEGGAFADSGAPAHATSQNVVANVAGLADAFRSAGRPVIHVWYVVEKGAAGLRLNAPLFARLAGHPRSTLLLHAGLLKRPPLRPVELAGWLTH